MKTKTIVLAITSVLLVCAITINLVGCTTTVKATNLMDGITPNKVDALNSYADKNKAASDFALRLFKATEVKGKNTLISPLSVLCALAMTANGAEGETLEQMESTLGMSRNDINLYIYSYIKSLENGDKYKLSTANSVWFIDDEKFTVNKSFLQTNADYYGANVYKTPFDEQTLKDINNWVKENTDEMIPEILDTIPEGAVMYLVNALAFEAEWEEPYKKADVSEGTFTKEDGTKQTAKFMYGIDGTYLEDEKATGFIKRYSGGKYAFVALLPNEGISVSEYVSSLDGEGLCSLFENAERTTVKTAIPKFENEYSVEISEELKKMGMPKAFCDEAEFNGLGTYEGGGLFISRVLHKTYISVAEKGTKAGAATAVEVNTEGEIDVIDSKTVYLDRPFVYMLIDCKNNVPFFIGTLNDVK